MSHVMLVVVGHVNRGKSSIVSTLAADESVRIAPEPGTTTRNRAYPMRIGDQTLYTLIDTPGFERARQALEWLRSHTSSTADRAQAVRRFVDYFANNPRFRAECELLRPILEGGAILYVVDGSVPFSPHYEAEMELLRWTNRPRMALINTIGPDDHRQAWRGVLGQYFSLVRDFDAHDCGFRERIELLWAIRELNENWRPRLDKAIEALEQERSYRLREAAGIIARNLAEMLTHLQEQRLPDDAEPAPYKAPLADRYYNTLRRIERQGRSQLRDLYDHRTLQVIEPPLKPVNHQVVGSPAPSDAQPDLFDVDTWSRIGLSRDQLAATATFTGALAGGIIDAAVGGASVMIGSLVGGAIGFSSTWFGWRHLEEVKVLGQRFAGKLLRIGPMTNPRFAWVALDRALIYHRLLAARPHADRSAADLGEYSAERGIVRTLEPSTRAEIERCFSKLRRGADAPAITGKLAHSIAQVLSAQQ